MIKEEKKMGNPLANYIHKLKLEKNMVIILLDCEDDGEDSDLDPEGMF